MPSQTPIGLTRKMADGFTDAKTDVKMSFEEWRKLATRPVFFLEPSGVKEAIKGGVNVERVYKRAGELVSAPLGRDAIKRALDCQPTFLSKALDIKNVVNALHPGALGDEGVVAAVFALPKLKATLAGAGMDATGLAKATKYDVAVCQSAIDNYRVTLDFALKVVKALSLPPTAITILEGDRQFIQNLGTKENPKYVFDMKNLVAAPAKGHPWARA